MRAASLSSVLTTSQLAMALFYLQPFCMGCWLALIPQMKQTLGLGEADLALALLGMPIAVVPMLQVAGRVTARHGPRRTLTAALPAQAAALALIPFATSQGALFLALLLFGAVGAFLQVALNIYAGRLEKSEGVYIMSRCHGFWALGLMSGSLAAAALAALPIEARALAVGIPATALGIAVARTLPRLPAGAAAPQLPRRRFREIPPEVFLIALFALGIALTEGAMSDWSAVYMTERLGGDAVRGALAVTIYSSCLAAGRFAGDLLRARFGIVALARGLTAIALAGVVLLALPFGSLAAWAGFAAVGAGVSVGFPMAVSAVAAIGDRHEAANIAIMSTVAISGFLIGPPMIGYLSEATSLRFGLLSLAPVLAASFVLAASLGRGRGGSRT